MTFPEANATADVPADRSPPATPAELSAANDHHALPAETIDRLGEDRDFVTALARGLAVMLSLSDKRRRMSIGRASCRERV